MAPCDARRQHRIIFGSSLKPAHDGHLIPQKWPRVAYPSAGRRVIPEKNRCEKILER